VSEAKWEEERETLLERLRKAEQIAAESQAEAAVYRDMLEDCYEAAKQAYNSKNIDLLPKIIRFNSMGFTMPSEREGKALGKLFLNAYMRDARWLRHAKKALGQIKSDAESLVEDNQINAELKKKIVASVEDGLITHI
jgi:hypothetical protein